MEQLTRRQSEVLDLIRRWIADTGYPPTRADIASELGFRSPNAAEEHLRALARKGAAMPRPRADIMLRVRGQSMRDAGILDGDLLAVHKTESARNGQIVVARIEDEVTVKRFQQDTRARHRITLVAENPDFDPI